MKAVIQRVLKASVTVSDEIVGSIQHGLCVLIGISRDDNDKDMEYIAKKILSIRLFESGDDTASAGKWSKSVVDRDFEILCVSQFTLQSTLKGTKPDFHLAMSSEIFRSFKKNVQNRKNKRRKVWCLYASKYRERWNSYYFIRF